MILHVHQNLSHPYLPNKFINNPDLKKIGKRGRRGGGGGGGEQEAQWEEKEQQQPCLSPKILRLAMGPQ